jgi:hypothetical protein
VIQEEWLSREPLFVFHSVPQLGDFPYSVVKNMANFLAILSTVFCVYKELLFLMILSASFKRSVTKRGAGSFKETAPSDSREVNSRFSSKENFGPERTILERFPFRNRLPQPAIRETRKVKDTKVFRSTPAWEPPPRLDVRKYVRGVTLRRIISNDKPNGKFRAMGVPQVYPLP